MLEENLPKNFTGYRFLALTGGIFDFTNDKLFCFTLTLFVTRLNVALTRHFLLTPSFQDLKSKPYARANKVSIKNNWTLLYMDRKQVIFSAKMVVAVVTSVRIFFS